MQVLAETCSSLSPEAYLSPGIWSVSAHVLHVWKVCKLDLAAGEGSADVAAGGVIWVGHRDRACCLCHAVALNDHRSKADPQELHDLAADWGRPSRHDPHLTCDARSVPSPDCTGQSLTQWPRTCILGGTGRGSAVGLGMPVLFSYVHGARTSKPSLDLGKHQPVPERAKATATEVALLQSCTLGRIRHGKQPACHRVACPNRAHHPIIDAVVQAWYTGEDCGLQLQHVVQQLSDLSPGRRTGLSLMALLALHPARV